MLIRFEVANYRSILESAELSMVAIDKDWSGARETAGLNEKLLTVAGIYGPNASGKTNLLAALVWLRDAVRTSLRLWDDEIPVEPFVFGPGPSRLSEFTIETTISGVRFEYILELSREKVVYEALFHYPQRKRRRVFERDGQELVLQRGLGVLSGTRELMTERTLALAVARRFEEPLVTDFTHDLFSFQSLGGVRDLPHPASSTVRWFENSYDQPATHPIGDSGLEDAPALDRERALALLRLADVGVDDVVVDEVEVTYGDGRGENGTRKRPRVRLVHRALDERLPLDFVAESSGTRTWFRLIGPVLRALRDGSVMLFDELDASLHPTLSAQVIDLFHDEKTNPNHAQLIFTSHDTSLLNHLNRDEVWLTEKGRDGGTRLGALAEFAGERVRKSQNLERGYLHGRFGALPDVDRTELYRALGLIG